MSQSTWSGRGGGELEDQGRPSGCVLVVLKGHDVVVWLIGEIDSNVAIDLDDIVKQTPDITSRMIVDASRVTFCDSTALRFLATVAAIVPVTIRGPSRVFADLVSFSGLAQNPWIHTESGARP
jgi:anti-anti-sigma regulatory factor